jgi:hypothetical protein
VLFCTIYGDDIKSLTEWQEAKFMVTEFLNGTTAYKMVVIQ